MDYEPMPYGRPRRRRKSPWGIVKWGLVVVFLLALTAYTLFWPESAPPPMTAERKQAAAAHIQQARDTIERVRQDAKAGIKRAFSIELTDDDMNHFLETDEQTQRVLSGHDIDHAWIHFAPGKVEAHAARGVLSVKATVTPVVDQDGTFAFRVDKVDVGRLPIPGAQEKAERAIGMMLEAARKMVEGVRVEKIDVLDSKLVISGQTK